MPLDRHVRLSFRTYGYAFCGDAVGEDAPLTSRSRYWLLCEDDEFPLLPGEHLIGRGPDVHVFLDAAGVSRRHARIVISDDEIVLEDAGSKNGTFVGGERILARRALVPDEVLSFGPVRAVLHAAPAAGSTESLTISSSQATSDVEM